MPPKSKRRASETSPQPAFQTPAMPRARQATSNNSASASASNDMAARGFSSRHPRDEALSGSDSPAPASGPNGGGGAGGTDTQQYKVARAISSCVRCRSRKQRCDGKLPACSACERAKVECIGFDAISKTNISRTHLHSLEQELADLRAQLAVYQSGLDPASLPQRTAPVASPASAGSTAHGSHSVVGSTVGGPSHFRPPTPQQNEAMGLSIDPALTALDYDAAPRSSWDSPGSALHHHVRRSSEVLLSSPHGHGDRSPSLSNAMNPKSQALTRMVHDAALRTGHASNQATAISAFNAPGTGHGHHGHGHGHYPLSHSHSYAGSSHGYGHGHVHIPSNLSDKGSVPPFSPADDFAVSPQLLSRNIHGSNANANGRQGSIGAGHHSGANAVSTPLSDSGKSRSARKNFTIPPLPPQPAVERLVAAYVDFVGVTAPIIHIPSLGQQLTRLREGRDVEESDVFVVMMVLALSTMASARFVDPPDELRACSEAFHAEAMKHLDAVFEEQSYVGLQAILLLIWYSLLNPEKGSIWFLVGLATRTCVDMGYHNEHNVQVDKLDALELDMRRRLFYCTYKMDRLLSQALGRPPSIPDGFINVPLPSTLHDVDIVPGHFGPLTGENCAYKAVFVHTVKMSQLQSEILTNTFGIHGGRYPSPEWANDCHERLKEWLSTTPEPRGAMTNEGFASGFHNTVLLLFRPSPGQPRPDRQALATVMASSSYIIRIYRRMQLNNRISWLWMTSHFCFMAGLSFLYAFLNMHHASAGGEGIPSLDEAIMDIESCLSTLEYLAPRVPSAAACHDTMQSVSSSILEQLRQSQARAPASSASAPGSTPPSASSHRGGVLRRAPISSSRDDPLPRTDYLAPLPAVTLPYELSLLDNLFVNPMASHSKASDYTNGAKNRAACVAEVRSAFAGHFDAVTNGSSGSGSGAGASGGNINGAPGMNNISNNSVNAGAGKGISAWQMAAGVKRERPDQHADQTECPTIEQSLAGMSWPKRPRLSETGGGLGSAALLVTSASDAEVNGNGNGSGNGSVAGTGAGGYGLSRDQSHSQSQAQSQHGASNDQHIHHSALNGSLDPMLAGPTGYEGDGEGIRDGQGAMYGGGGGGIGSGAVGGDQGAAAYGFGGLNDGTRGNIAGGGYSTFSQPGSGGGGGGQSGNTMNNDGVPPPSGLEGLGDFDIFSFLDDGFAPDAGLDGMALWS